MCLNKETLDKTFCYLTDCEWCVEKKKLDPSSSIVLILVIFRYWNFDRFTFGCCKFCLPLRISICRKIEQKKVRRCFNTNEEVIEKKTPTTTIIHQKFKAQYLDRMRRNEIRSFQDIADAVGVSYVSWKRGCRSLHVCVCKTVWIDG